MTMLAKRSLAIQKKRLAKCAKTKKCSPKKTARIKKNIAGLNTTGKTKVRRGVDKGVEVGQKVANSKVVKGVTGIIKVVNKVKNGDLKGAVNEGKNTLRNVKNAKAYVIGSLKKKKK